MSKAPWSYRLYRWAWSGLDLLFPPVCGGCGKSGWRWCPECQSRVPHINKPYCDGCGIPTQGTDCCEKRKINPPAYRKLRSWAVFDSPIQNGLHTMKYLGNIGLGDALASQMAGFLRSLQWGIDIMIPVPLGRKRLKERGYNQVALVAQPLAYHTGIQYAPYALWKARETRSQVGLNVMQRRENVQNAYEADGKVVKDRSVLLMDE